MAVEAPRKGALDHQLESVGWALFLIMIGGLMLVPGVPSGTWLVGTGLIMLGVNAVRRLNGITPSAFTVVLGVLAIAFGVAEMIGTSLPVFPLALILIGASILWRGFVERRPVS